MKIISKLIRSVWLFAMLIAFGPLLPIVASGFSVAPNLFAYDEPNQARIAYDRGSLSAFKYDLATVLITGGNESRTTEASGVLTRIAEFLAAKTPLTSTVADLRAAGLKDAHHVIQDAAVRDLPGYNTQLAPGVQLSGPSTAVGSPHYIATQVQRQAGGGTLAAEMRIGYKSLRQAGYSEPQARQIIAESDAYFRSIGATPSTPTRIPGNR